LIIKYTDDLLIGHETIDFQHREIFRKIGFLHQAAKQGEGLDEIKNTLKFLEIYIVEHFSEEECLMKGCSYPDIFEHVAEHNEFKKEIGSFLIKLKRSHDLHNLLIDTLNTSLLWITNHIRISDIAMGRFLNENSNVPKSRLQV